MPALSYSLNQHMGIPIDGGGDALRCRPMPHHCISMRGFCAGDFGLCAGACFGIHVVCFCGSVQINVFLLYGYENGSSRILDRYEQEVPLVFLYTHYVH